MECETLTVQDRPAAGPKEKKCVILGSTGSIGVNALNVISSHPERFRILALTANKNADRLIEQALMVRPERVVIADRALSEKVELGLAGTGIEVYAGYDAVVETAGMGAADLVLNAIVGSRGLHPTAAALQAGHDVALSNKESLVMAGAQINALAAAKGAAVYPVDSEHSAIWQCLAGEDPQSVEKIILTGSGGPFLNRDLSSFSLIRPEEALKHPNWSMGAKITIDSATMMNKGLELIEAVHLFGIPAERIEILIHPQSIIHSMVQFHDRSIKAQLGVPDMKVPIQYALSWPERLPAAWEPLDFVQLGQMTFFAPDLQRFPALGLAYRALEEGGSYPAVLNVVNEQAVYLFLKGLIRFTDISDTVERMLNAHQSLNDPSIEDILQLENELIEKMKEVEAKL